MRPDAMRPRSRPKPERVRPRPNDLASRPRGPRGLNIPVEGGLLLRVTKGRMKGGETEFHGKGWEGFILLTS